MVSVVLRSSDGGDHVVPQEAACLSSTVCNLLEQLEGKLTGGLILDLS